jgi:anti-anti-sigma factor
MGQPLFSYTVDRHGEDVCLALAGELDLSVVGQLEAALREAAAVRPRTLTVDVAGVGFIDSYSIGLLVRACNAARADGRGFTVVDSRGMVRQVLQMMGLADYLAAPGATTSTEST